MDYSALQHECISLARAAGEAIMPFYNNNVEVMHKEDKSPVTQADIAAHHIIDEGLRVLTPDIPVISEEGHHDLADNAERFWLVDPLDGTKSFIRGSGAFTVNIGLIENRTPTLGVIYLPVEHISYAGIVGLGAKKIADEKEIPIQTTGKQDGPLNVVVSMSHLDPKTDAFLADIAIASRIAGSSSEKFCAVAEGRADLYPRFGPTMEWDTAAGHAIVEAAGGSVIDEDGAPFTYHKPGFKNGVFVVWA